MTSETLSHRERMLRTLRFQPVDRAPDLEFGAWVQTVERWQREGMETYATEEWSPIPSYFGTDDDDYGPGLNINVGLSPGLQRIVLEDRGMHQLIQDGDGAISEQLKPEYGASIPRYLRYCIETREDWIELRDKHLNPDHPDRLPPFLDARIRRLQGRDYPLSVFVGSLYGYVRNWMGVQRLSTMLYDDRPLVEEIMEHLTQLTLSVLGKLAGRGIEIDVADWWEDMCYNHGPLISPRLFAELVVPRYQRITRYLRDEFGTEFNQLDCDGNIHELVPLWSEAGINVMFPIEVAHTDPYRISDEYGRRMPLRGAFDKRALIAGPAAIDAEFARLRPLYERGGFIPHTDHLVPPDVSLESYTHYRRRKCELLGKPWREPGLRPRPGQIGAWRVMGPFDAADLESAGPHGIGSQTGQAGRPLTEQRHEPSAQSGYVDLAAALGAGRQALATAACALHAPSQGEGWLELGSSGPLQVWLNGECVWRRDALRKALPGQDLVAIRLREGQNELLLQVAQGESDWGFYCRLTNDRGQPWPEVKAGD